MYNMESPDIMAAMRAQPVNPSIEKTLKLKYRPAIKLHAESIPLPHTQIAILLTQVLHPSSQSSPSLYPKYPILKA